MKSTRLEDPHPSSRFTTKSTIPEDLRSLPPSLLPLFSLAEKLRMLRESSPKMHPTFVFCTQSAQSTAACFIEAWNGFSFFSRPFWAFTALEFYPIFLLIAHHNNLGSFIEDHAVSRSQEACGVWNMSEAAAQTTVADFPGLSSSWVFFRRLLRWGIKLLCWALRMRKPAKALAEVDLALYGHVHKLWTKLRHVRDRNKTPVDWLPLDLLLDLRYTCLNTLILLSA